MLHKSLFCLENQVFIIEDKASRAEQPDFVGWTVWLRELPNLPHPSCSSCRTRVGQLSVVRWATLLRELSNSRSRDVQLTTQRWATHDTELGISGVVSCPTQVRQDGQLAEMGNLTSQKRRELRFFLKYAQLNQGTAVNKIHTRGTTFAKNLRRYLSGTRLSC